MSFSPADLATRLRKSGEETVSFFEAIPAEEWEVQVYTDGQHWTIHQILTHITQTEKGIFDLVMRVVRGEKGLPEDFNIDDYNHQKVGEMQLETPEGLLHLFSKRREKLILWVETLHEDDLHKLGRHPWLGVARVLDILKLLYRHVKIHQRDIRRLLKGLA